MRFVIFCNENIFSQSCVLNAALNLLFRRSTKMATSVRINPILDGETENLIYCQFLSKYLVEIVCYCSGKSPLLELTARDLMLGGYTCRAECLACGKTLLVRIEYRF